MSFNPYFEEQRNQQHANEQICFDPVNRYSRTGYDPRYRSNSEIDFEVGPAFLDLIHFHDHVISPVLDIIVVIEYSTVIEPNHFKIHLELQKREVSRSAFYSSLRNNC